MSKYSRYKVNCSEVSELMAHDRGFKPVTDDDWDNFKRIIDKSPRDITELQIQSLRDHILRTIDEQNPPLANTAKKNIYKHYAYAEFGASKVSNGGKVPIQLDKGEIAEPDAINLLSTIDGVFYVKNEKMFSNRFLKGIPDIVLYENDKIVGVKDIKVPADLLSFLERVDGDHLVDDRWEMLAYLDVLGLKEGEICYCLVDMPQSVVDQRMKDSENRYISYGYSPSHIKKLLKRLEISMKYDYIPQEKRIRRFKVSRKSYFTSQMHRRVKLMRERMANLHEKFEKGLFLYENTEQLPPESIS